MFKVIIKDVGYVKEFNEEFSREKLVEMLIKLGEENEQIDGFCAYIKREEEWCSLTYTYYITFLTKLIHRSLNNVENTLITLLKMKAPFESKVIILNDKTQVKETMNGLEFRSIFLKKFENCTADKAIKWLEKNKVSFIVKRNGKVLPNLTCI